MGEPYKDQDLEKGQPSEGISNSLSKAGVASAIPKAGEGSPATETTPNGNDKTTQKQKQNPESEKVEKEYNDPRKHPPHEESKDTNIIGNITKLLPANTFLMFQTLAPLATNDGKCGKTEIIMTSAMLIILACTCMLTLVSFTDTIQFNGKVYHGFVTRGGLWNPRFKGDPSLVILREHEDKLHRKDLEAREKGYSHREPGSIYWVVNRP